MALFLCATMHQGDERFSVQTRGKQCAFMSLAAVITARVGKCSYINCSYMFLYYIRKFFCEAKMFLYVLIFLLIIPF